MAQDDLWCPFHFCDVLQTVQALLHGEALY